MTLVHLISVLLFIFGKQISPEIININKLDYCKITMDVFGDSAYPELCLEKLSIFKLFSMILKPQLTEETH
jgi:hypothetical protein